MPTPAPHADDRPQPRQFHTTHWSVVLTAGRRATPESAGALETLCQAYWYPLYLYVRRREPDLNEAQDLTQAFFAELLEKNYVATATPQRGRFRSFLLTALQHFLTKQWDKGRALKRGGGKPALSLDFAAADSRYGSEPCARLTPEQLYDRQWAVTLLEQIMQRLEQDFVARGKPEQFGHLKGFVIGDHAGDTYAAAAARLGTSEAAVKMSVHRLRQRYRQFLREQIAATVSTPEEVEEEIQNLFAALQ